MTQDSIHMSWSHQELQNRLRDIMTGIHQEYVEHGSEKGYVDYMKGVNIAGLTEFADAVLAYGVT